ncbi:hypothetical protein vBVpaMR16F_119 [Vibrio phage vB_VpaM_R16F]|nr:hypothetical protein vBVpaMR16F_119 [Vibrio phage vB_VpaM_R16F]
MNKNTVRRRKGVMKIFLDGVKTKVSNFTSPKNNGHHLTFQLPDGLIPSGMQKHYGKHRVVIKDLEMMQYVEESINKDLDIVKEQVNYAIEDLCELENLVVSVYKDFSEEEVMKESLSIRNLWYKGKEICDV